jgi:hypothetical protein
MNCFVYNDITFTLAPSGAAWDITRSLPDQQQAVVASKVFAGATASEAASRAQALVHSIYPVGVKLVGPDVAHPNTVGDVRIVGPNVGHPNFIHWDKGSSAFPA